MAQPVIITDNHLTGKKIGCFDVLSLHHKTGKWYVRISLGGKYCIARASEHEIINNIVPDKIMKKLVENSYLNYSDSSSVLYDINGNTFIIDTEDLERVLKITWRVSTKIRGKKDYISVYGGKYDNSTGKWTHYQLSRYIMGMINESTDTEVDHINLDNTNNRKDNLRKATKVENIRHRSLFSNNESGFTGVRLDKRSGTYQARITVDGKQVYLGESHDIEIAKQLRIDAEKKYFSEFSTARHLENDNKQRKGDK